ncbi:MAG TPA: thiamine phosphate synthase [Methyloceanibacter sp.]|nr:thiamine phosphate synthase [Methyloceanibacter sp.]
MAETAPPCRLYLIVPASPYAAIERSLAEALAAADVACVLLSAGDGEPDPALEARLRELTQARDVAFLIENDAARAERIGADGVHIPADAALYGQTREHLGQRAIIGVGCNESRHEAMLLAELGADYVAFGSTPALGDRGREERAGLIAWWPEIFVVPCVAWNVETQEEAAGLAGLGVDFVALSSEIWLAEDPAGQIAGIGAALRKARSPA